MMEKWKPCPFCGGEDLKLLCQKGGVMDYYHIECDDCYCGTGYEDSKEYAIEAWNRRAEK